MRGLPTYKTPVNALAKSVGLGLLVAVVVAVLWRFFPQWQFYLCLLLGFGAVETMAKAVNYKRGADLQAAAIAVVVVGMVLARVLLAQRYGITLGDVNSLSDAIATPQVISQFRGYVPVDYLLQLRFVPDLIFSAMPVAIAWYRFRYQVQPTVPPMASQPSSPYAGSGQVQCSYHPNTLTGLRCSRCGKPICPQCDVRTPV
ncbi:MAG: B-box zinc finger protein, partial [Thermomicrobiales bacterium]